MGFAPYAYKQNQEVMQLVAAGGRLEKPLGVPDDVSRHRLYSDD